MQNPLAQVSPVCSGKKLEKNNTHQSKNASLQNEDWMHFLIVLFPFDSVKQAQNKDMG